MRVTPDSSAFLIARTDSAWVNPCHLSEPICHPPMPMTETFGPLLPSLT